MMRYLSSQLDPVHDALSKEEAEAAVHAGVADLVTTPAARRFVTDATVRRYLRARGGNVAKAIKALRRVHVWRRGGGAGGGGVAAARRQGGAAASGRSPRQPPPQPDNPSPPLPFRHTLEWRAMYKPEEVAWTDVAKMNTGRVELLPSADRAGRPVVLFRLRCGGGFGS